MILSYARVSTREQAEDGATSIDEQVRKARAIAELRGAGQYDFVTYIDAGVSGSIPLADRPQGRELLAAARAGDTIISSKMDRLFRSAMDALNTAARLKEKGVDLILIDLGTEPVTGRGAAKVFFGMLAIFAEFERDRINERIRDGRKGKKERNGHLGGPAPFGYRVVGAGRAATLEPDVQEQKTLQRIQELNARTTRKRRKFAAIRKTLLAEGLMARTGKPWQTVQVQRIVERLGA